MREWSGSNPEKRRASSGVGLILVVLVAAVGATYLASGTLRGAIAALLWSEAEMLTCDGGQTITLQGREIEITDPVLDVGGLCELLVLDCTLKSDSTAIQVGGNARVRIENSRLIGRLAALRVRGNAEVLLLNTELHGRDAIDAGNNARVEVRGGSVAGEQSAVTAYNAAEVKSVGATSLGPMKTEQQGRVEGFARGDEALGIAPEPAAEAPPEPAAEAPPEPAAEAPPEIADEGEAQAKAPPADPWGQAVAVAEAAPAEETDEQKYQRYAAGACSGVLVCYQENDFVGHVAGKISMKVDARGKVRTIRSKLPGASRKIGLCIKRTCKRKRIDDFEGPPGTLVCNFAGTLSGGSVMISRSGEFLPKKQRKRGRRSRRSR